MIRVVNEALERTAQLTGQTTQQVLEAWIKNDAPLFGVGGLGLGLAGSGMVRSQNPNRPPNYVERRY